MHEEVSCVCGYASYLDLEAAKRIIQAAKSSDATDLSMLFEKVKESRKAEFSRMVDLFVKYGAKYGIEVVIPKYRSLG